MNWHKVAVRLSKPDAGPLDDPTFSGANRITGDGATVIAIDTGANTFTVTGAMVANATGGPLNVVFNWLIFN